VLRVSTSRASLRPPLASASIALVRLPIYRVLCLSHPSLCLSEQNRRSATRRLQPRGNCGATRDFAGPIPAVDGRLGADVPDMRRAHGSAHRRTQAAEDRYRQLHVWAHEGARAQSLGKVRPHEETALSVVPAVLGTPNRDGGASVRLRFRIKLTFATHVRVGNQETRSVADYGTEVQ
jgi:hypothetical protein